MITQVSTLNTGGIFKDPRRKAQSVQFRRSSNIPYKSSYNDEYEKKNNNALRASISVIIGSLLFSVGYLIFSGSKKY